MHPDMVGLTGSPEQVKAAADAFKALTVADMTRLCEAQATTRET